MCAVNRCMTASAVAERLLKILQGLNMHLYSPRVHVVQMQGPVEAYRGTYATAPA